MPICKHQQILADHLAGYGTTQGGFGTAFDKGKPQNCKKSIPTHSAYSNVAMPLTQQDRFEHQQLIKRFLSSIMR
ncbi:MAG: hypothetical protein ABL887_08180 [Nitrosomonas sp.]